MKKFGIGTLFAIISLLATIFATTVATSACYFYTYQPQEPDCLKDM